MDNSLVDVDKVGLIDSRVEGTNNNRVSSSKGNRYLGWWGGYEVNSEFVCMLDHIMQKYPETFKPFTTKNKKLCTVRLNMLCTSLNEFTNISMAEVDSEIKLGVEPPELYTTSMVFEAPNHGGSCNSLSY